MFYASPVWAISAKCHLTKLQVLQNKLLKLIFDLPRLYSTGRLHQIAEMDLVVSKIERLSSHFYSRCSQSEYNHIVELASH